MVTLDAPVTLTTISEADPKATW